MESIDEFMEKVNISKHIIVEILPADEHKLMHLDGKIQVIYPKKKSAFLHLMITSNQSEQNYSNLVELGYKPAYVYDYEKRMRLAICKTVKDDYVEEIKNTPIDIMISPISRERIDVVEHYADDDILDFDKLRTLTTIPELKSSSDTDEDDSIPTQYQLFLTNLQNLGPSPTKREVGNLMYYAIMHSSFASALSKLICAAVLEKPIVLYLVNDILANCNCGRPDAWRFKVELEKLLPKVFKRLHEKWKSMGLLRKEEMRKFVMSILINWEKIIGLDSVDQLRNAFLGWETITDEDLGLVKQNVVVAANAVSESKIDEDCRFKPIAIADKDSRFKPIDTKPENATEVESRLNETLAPKLSIKPITLQPKKAFQMKLATMANPVAPLIHLTEYDRIIIQDEKKKADVLKPTITAVAEEEIDDSVLLAPDPEVDGFPFTEDEVSDDGSIKGVDQSCTLENSEATANVNRSCQEVQKIEESDDDMFS